MKKTVNMNIGGYSFSIDEDAYQKLEVYLESIEKHFTIMEEKKEIISDIELRVAEIFRERLYNREVVIMEDVDTVISLLGTPGDFENTTGGTGKKVYQAGHVYRRLYRDPDNRLLGGVCAGLGAYFHVDPNIVRVIFIIIFLGFGVGLIIYLVLWIVIPEAKTVTQKLEMKGKPVNFSNIADSVKEEFKRVKNKWR